MGEMLKAQETFNEHVWTLKYNKQCTVNVFRAGNATKMPPIKYLERECNTKIRLRYLKIKKCQEMYELNKA